MDHKTKNTGDAPNGVVYTFIQKEFGRGIFPRKGACVDSENITRAFTQPNYVVKPPYIDKSTSEIEYALNDASAEDNSKYALIVIIIISHFDMIGEILTKDGSIMEKSVMEYFDGLKCPDLIETPKFFIFQISKCQKYTLTPSTSSVEADGGTETFEPIFTLPNEANILTFRSSYEGGPEFKPVDTGSYVIKTICEHMEQNGKKHIFDMMHGVLYDIKENKKMNQERGAQNNSVYTILPELCSTLTEDLYFGDEQNNRASIPIQMYEKKKKMGKVYIINYLNVWDKKKKEILGREGSEKDVKAILKCFSGLGFDPKQVTDQKKDDMITTLKEDLRDTPADKYTCIVIFFMTHGINGSLGTADLPLTEEELYSILSMEKFDGIPKAIFFQVCRGNEPSVPVPRKSVITIPNNNVLDNNESTLTSDSKASANEEENINPLSHDDFLVFHSSYSNRSSHRDEKHGSWFIQSICTEFEKLDDFVSLPKMCIKISKLVAELPVRLTKDYKAAKQMPVFRMTFTNPLTLNRFDKDLANNAPPSNYETEVTRM